MPAKPPTRCYRTYRCDCRKHAICKSAAVTWSPKRLRAIAPKAPPCPWCGELMERCGVVYQGMLHSSWDLHRPRTRQMFSAMLGRG